MIRQKSGAGSAAVRLATAIFATFSLAAGLLVATAPLAAEANTGSEFDPGYIISDQQFYARDAMSVDEIQAFLDSKIGTCNNSNCLNIVRTNTFSRAQDRTVCNAYQGAAAETTAAIIYKVQQACGISAKVLLVTLQKEQGLITAKSPSLGRLDAAMGYGCPDTAPCDAEFYGLYNQLYKAAWQFKRYSTPDPWGNIQPGGNNIAWSTNDCGVGWVLVKNNATAALYNYTPYQPNQAALDNLGAEGDWCSSYGNRNFWDYYYDWFGNPTGIVPANVATSRLSGVDRFDTAVQISKARPNRAAGGTVYITNGRDYPDALSAAPAATQSNAPLLLVEPTSIPAVVKQDLIDLAPSLIVVVGGESAVSADTYTELATYAAGGNIRRDGGTDRYDTSRKIAEAAFPTPTVTAYVATGLGFADALSASAAAGSKHAPVLLVDGKAGAVDAATIATLTKLGVTKVIVAGGPVAVSDGILASLNTGAIQATRIGGKDRFTVASNLNKDAFKTSPTIYLAAGYNFPDALAGAALAGSQNSALYLAFGNCVFRQTAQDIIDLKATKVVLLGGAAVLNGSVPTFANCD